MVLHRADAHLRVGLYYLRRGAELNDADSRTRNFRNRRCRVAQRGGGDRVLLRSFEKACHAAGDDLGSLWCRFGLGTTHRGGHN